MMIAGFGYATGYNGTENLKHPGKDTIVHG